MSLKVCHCIQHAKAGRWRALKKQGLRGALRSIGGVPSGAIELLVVRGDLFLLRALLPCPGALTRACAALFGLASFKTMS